MPTDVRPRVHALALTDSDHAASFEDVVEEAERFGINKQVARQLARDVAIVVRDWRKAARRVGLTSRELERMESAFEHDDLAAALS